MGPAGLAIAARRSAVGAHVLAEKCTTIEGFSLVYSGAFFKEFVLSCPLEARTLNRRLFERGIIGGVELGRYFPGRDNEMLICVTEKRTLEEIDRFTEALREAAG